MHTLGLPRALGISCSRQSSASSGSVPVHHHVPPALSLSSLCVAGAVDMPFSAPHVPLSILLPPFIPSFYIYFWVRTKLFYTLHRDCSKCLCVNVGRCIGKMKTGGGEHRYAGRH